MPHGPVYVHTSDGSSTNFIGGLIVLVLPCFIEIPVLNANNVDPDQTTHTAVSDLGLHVLQMPHLWDARLNWEDVYIIFRSIRSPLAQYRLPKQTIQDT